MSYQSQDGYGTGEPDGVSIDGTGQIIGSFTNGYQQVLGQVALANFADETGLVMVGGNNFVSALVVVKLLSVPPRAVDGNDSGFDSGVVYHRIPYSVVI